LKCRLFPRSSPAWNTDQRRKLTRLLRLGEEGEGRLGTTALGKMTLSRIKQGILKGEVSLYG
jgi:hypothetical protein